MHDKRPHIAAFLATSGHSGVDRIMANLLPEMARQGARVDLLKVKRHGPYIDDRPDGFRVIELGSAHANTSLIPLIRYLRRERPDVVLSDKDRVNRTAMWATALARTGTRNVVRLGTTVSRNLERKSRLERWAQATSIRRFYNHADRVIVPSAGVAHDLTECYGIHSDRIAVLPSPVLTARAYSLAQDEAPLPWSAETPYVLGVGHFCERKDFATLIRAVAQVRKTHTCNLVLLGQGKEHDHLQQLAGELGFGDDIYMPGFSPNPYAYMRNASVFALTSRWEGMPVVLVESLGMGTPVVATDCPSGPKELLRDGALGALVPMGDVDATAQAIIDTLERPLPERTLKDAVASYDVTASAAEYLRVCCGMQTNNKENQP